MTGTAAQPRLAALPAELREDILAKLCWADISNLRLTCSAFSKIFLPKGNRVFLSANPFDIQVLRAVADNEVLRHGIRELIWDDSHFQQPDSYLGGQIPWTSEHTKRSYRGKVPVWYMQEWEKVWIEYVNREGAYHAEERQQKMMKNFRDAMSMKESWNLFLEIWQAQEEVIAANQDVDAFRYALQRFSALEAVTITPAAHGVGFARLYKTPAMRNYPPGFIYPEPVSWPACERDHDNTHAPHALSWTQMEKDHAWLIGWPGTTIETYRERWRGFRAAIRILAEVKFRLRELNLFSHYRIAGINCRIFRQDCPEYRHLCQIVSTPGFRKMHLSLAMERINKHGFNSLNKGLFRDMLARATDMEHFTLQTTTLVEGDFMSMPFQYPGPDPCATMNLRKLIPVERWPKLESIFFSRPVVTMHELIRFLQSLPPTVRSVGLCTVMLKSEEEGGHRRLLRKMRETLGWRERPPAERPCIRYSVLASTIHPMHYVLMGDFVERYMYGNSPNPFLRGQQRGGAHDRPKNGFGIVKADVLENSEILPLDEWDDLYRKGFVGSPSVKDEMKAIIEAKGLPARLLGDHGNNYSRELSAAWEAQVEDFVDYNYGW